MYLSIRKTNTNQQKNTIIFSTLIQSIIIIYKDDPLHCEVSHFDNIKLKVNFHTITENGFMQRPSFIKVKNKNTYEHIK